MKSFLWQLVALVRKNFLVSVARRPIGFVLSTYGLPLAILALLLSIPSFFPDTNSIGISDAKPIRSLADTVNRKLVIVRPLNLGSDVDDVIGEATHTLRKDLLVFQNNEDSLLSTCIPDTRGISDCHAIVIFKDSPRTNAPLADLPNKNHTWRYTIRADPARNNQNLDIGKHSGDQEDLYMPLQLAINNAITNSTVIPETIMFTRQEPASPENDFTSHAAIIGRIYVFALVVAHLSIVYRLTTFITSERDCGMSQLIDSMGGEKAIVTRVLSWLITVDLVALPCYIFMGVLYQRLAFPASSAALIIGWQILLGFAINSSAVFAAAFFSKSRVSAIVIILAFIVLSITAQMYASESRPHPLHMTVAALSLFFPSANSVYFTQQMCLWQLHGLSADSSQLPPEIPGLYSKSYSVGQNTLLGFLALNIFIYFIAAVGVEKVLHGIHYRKRQFSNSHTSSTSDVVRARGLRKVFTQNAFFRIWRFCICRRKKPVAAVDDISFDAQSGQIMCLVGQNGSGKSTTLHMLSGFAKPTEGSVLLEARPSQVGICPQNNTLWDNLTVEEHVHLWNDIKSGQRSHAALELLIRQCDLFPKRKFKARELSGGQKRKLQLACMFVGNSTICLIDECTSGLDPLSRRAIWEILLQQRSKRSIIFTTHFLDEVDILADYIVLLADGKIKCQGVPAQLKSQYGGGYKVLVPPSAPSLGYDYPRSTHQDKTIYQVPDSITASRMVSRYVDAGIRDVAISGPRFEEIFLHLLQDDVAFKQSTSVTSMDQNFSMTPGREISSWTQFRVLYKKRWTVLAKFWSPYLLSVIVPLAIMLLITSSTPDYKYPACDALQDTSSVAPNINLQWDDQCSLGRSTCDQLSISPIQANATLFSLFKSGYQELSDISVQAYNKFVAVQSSRDEMLKHIAKNKTLAGYGGIFAGSASEVPTIAYRILFSEQSGSKLLDIWSQMQGGIEINSSQEVIPKSRKAADMNGYAYLLVITIVLVLYPASFVLYPALEQTRKVRAVQYANGVRQAPLWAAYSAFDFLWVLIVSVGVTLLSAVRVNFNGPILVLLVIFALYGLAAMLMGYIIAHFTNGPLKSYIAALGFGLLSWVAISISTQVDDKSSTMAGIVFGVDLFLPIGNVFRALFFALNMKETGCRDGKPIDFGSIHGFGGPLLYLCLQVSALLFILTWLEGGFPKFRIGHRRSIFKRDKFAELELANISRQETLLESDISREIARAEKTTTDLLRVLHVSKNFGTNKAVDDVTFSLPRGDVMALLGANGAGKSTLANMMMQQIYPSDGEIMLCQEDSRRPSSKKHLGVCPQYDALDLMNTRDHLYFYGRIKGVTNVKENVDYIMAKLNLTRHARTQASKLSGGNKRKLMLAIALMGTPSVLVLDEPTSFMDAIAKRQFWKVIQEISEERSILLTTHSMEEADALSTRTLILQRRILAIGTTQSLRQRYSNAYFASLVLASAPTSSQDEMDRVKDWVQAIAPNARFEREILGGQVRFTVPSSASSEDSALPVVKLIETIEQDKNMMGIEHYCISGPTLEDVFLSVVKENNVEEESTSDAEAERMGAKFRFSWKASWLRL
ncbi:hypothetical protein QQS21_000519 [Conoideocrella luteorostrata]|uniref:ABC transporter domain-containing protein n=1 Tax=Conoideocrella luteorostrata TaxID=1105319 RepID=A0AAJ0G2G1_9HYPO|nr:hypothetical protein QQS21_000519 [Conoideocrella luteorostrata]